MIHTFIAFQCILCNCCVFTCHEGYVPCTSYVVRPSVFPYLGTSSALKAINNAESSIIIYIIYHCTFAVMVVNVLLYNYMYSVPVFCDRAYLGIVM